MGYDMRWIRKADGEEEAVEKARGAFRVACDVRDALGKEARGSWSDEEIESKLHFDDEACPANSTDEYRAAQAEVNRTYHALSAADRSYFRLNVWGMGSVRDAMEAFGAVYDRYSRDGQPEYPQDIPGEYYDNEDDPEFATIREQVQAHLSWSPLGPEHGIPVHKLCSNDGWHVLPEEAFVAAAKIRATDPADALKALEVAGITGEDWMTYWGQWVQWLADSSEHGGFEVH